MPQLGSTQLGSTQLGSSLVRHRASVFGEFSVVEGANGEFIVGTPLLGEFGVKKSLQGSLNDE